MTYKRIATHEWRGRFNYTNLYYTDGVKLVNDKFETVEKIVGKIFEEKELTREDIEGMIDRYAWCIDNYEQELKAERKNANIEKFLG